MFISPKKNAILPSKWRVSLNLFTALVQTMVLVWGSSQTLTTNIHPVVSQFMRPTVHPFFHFTFLHTQNTFLLHWDLIFYQTSPQNTSYHSILGRPRMSLTSILLASLLPRVTWILPTLISLNLAMASEWLRPATDWLFTEKISSPAKYQGHFQWIEEAEIKPERQR